jgi:DNA-directed RNA polymerase subunit delta
MPDDIIQQVKLKYPSGYESHLVSYTNAEGKVVTALPFATDSIYYLIRMTIAEARKIVRDDEDFDDEGVLRADFAEEPEVESEYGGGDEDVEDIADTSSNDDDEEDERPARRSRRNDDDDYNDDY